MFDLLKKRKKQENELSLYSVAKGNLIPITEVQDDVFSKKMLGDGYAIQPVDGKIYSPIKGEVISIFPTKHAIGLKSESGIEILVHIGIDTVDLKGVPFEIFIKEGDNVDNNTLLATVDLNMLKEEEKISDVLVIMTSDNYKELNIYRYGQVDGDSVVGSVSVP